MKNFIEAQDCSKCQKRDLNGGCTRPGVCIYVDMLAGPGETRMRENALDPQIAERMGEKGYLSLTNKMDIARAREVFKKHPEMVNIITMLVQGKTYKQISKTLGVHPRTISKASGVWEGLKRFHEWK